MPQQPSKKRVHYLRAMDSRAVALSPSLAELVVQMDSRLPTMVSTEMQLGGKGVFAVTNRDIKADRLYLHVARAVPGGSKSTIRLGTAATGDLGSAYVPPAGEEWRAAEGFCLIEANEILFCGHFMTPQTFVEYLSELLNKASVEQPAGGLHALPVTNGEKKRILDSSQVSEIEVEAAMYAATHLENKDQSKSFRESIASYLWALVRDDASLSSSDREQMVNEIADVNWKFSIKVRGGTRADPISVKAMQSLGTSLASEDEVEDQSPVKIKLANGHEVRGDELLLGGAVAIRHVGMQDNLDHADAWSKLYEKREELRRLDSWGR